MRPADTQRNGTWPPRDNLRESDRPRVGNDDSKESDSLKGSDCCIRFSNTYSCLEETEDSLYELACQCDRIVSSVDPDHFHIVLLRYFDETKYFDYDFDHKFTFIQQRIDIPVPKHDIAMLLTKRLHQRLNPFVKYELDGNKWSWRDVDDDSLLSIFSKEYIFFGYSSNPHSVWPNRIKKPPPPQRRIFLPKGTLAVLQENCRCAIVAEARTIDDVISYYMTYCDHDLVHQDILLQSKESHCEIQPEESNSPSSSESESFDWSDDDYPKVCNVAPLSDKDINVTDSNRIIAINGMISIVNFLYKLTQCNRGSFNYALLCSTIHDLFSAACGTYDAFCLSNGFKSKPGIILLSEVIKPYVSELVQHILAFVKSYKLPESLNGIQVQSKDDPDESNSTSIFFDLLRSCNSEILPSFIYLSTFTIAVVTGLARGEMPNFSALSRDCFTYGQNVRYEFATLVHLTDAVSTIMNFANKCFATFSMKGKSGQVLQLATRILEYPCITTESDIKALSEFGQLCSEYRRKYDTLSSLRHNLTYSLNSDGYLTRLELDRVYARHLQVMERINNYNNLMKSSELRVSPYSIVLYGGSSVGKSSVCQHLVDFMAHIMDLPSDPRFVHTISPGHKFMDGYCPWKPIVVMDDVAALRANCMPEGDTMVIDLMRFINNMPFLTNQAAIEAKADTPFMAKLMILTTNHKSLGAHDYFKEGAVITRRIRLYVTQKVRKEFATAGNALDPHKAAQWKLDNPDKIPDFWLFKLETFNVHNDGSARIKGNFDVLDHNGRLMDDISYADLCRFLRDDYSVFSKQQVVAIKPPKYAYCDVCKMYKEICVCHSIQTQSVEEYFPVQRVFWGVSMVALAIWWFRWMYYIALRVTSGYLQITSAADDLSRTCNEIHQYVERVNTGYTAVLPIVRATHTGILVIDSYIHRVRNIRRILERSATKVAIGVSISAIGAVIIAYATGYFHRKSIEVQGNVVSHGTPVPPMSLSSWGDGAPPLPYNASNISFTRQSQCIDIRSSHDASKQLGKYIGYFKVGENVSLKSDNWVGLCTSANGVMIATGVFLCNKHSLSKFLDSGGNKCVSNFQIAICFSERYSKSNPSTCTDANNGVSVANSHNENISANRVYLIPNSDIALIKLSTPRGGMKQLVCLDYNVHVGNGFTLTRKANGVLSCSTIGLPSTRCYRQPSSLTDGTIIDHCITCTTHTECGDSGTPIFINGGSALDTNGDRGPIAFAGILYGCYREGFSAGDRIFHCINLRDLEKHLSLFSQQLGESLLLQSDYGVSVRDSFQVISDELPHGAIHVGPTHEKSVVSVCYGECPGLGVYGNCAESTFHKPSKSQYKMTKFSTILERMQYHRVLGDLSCNFLPTTVTQSNRRFVENNTLQAMLSYPGEGVPQHLLDRAAASYLDDFFQRCSSRSCSSFTGIAEPFTNNGVPFVRPFSQVDAINGIPGVFHGLNMATGGGFGYSGPKSQYFTETWDGCRLIKIPIDRLQRDIDAIEDKLRRGIDPKVIFTSHIKDEVRSRDKVLRDKIRIMNGSPLPFTIVARKYLMSVILLMYKNKFESECAVGMNAESKQWGDFARYLQSFGGLERFLDGDYVDFDKNQKVNVSSTASHCIYGLIVGVCARHKDTSLLWDEASLLAARTICSSLDSPVVDFFSTLLELLGTNPSGHSLTTQKNCISNSLYMRCVFYSYPGNWTKNYRDFVAQVNYGDDVVMAVVDRCCMNHRYIRDTLGSWGVPYTKADKSEITDVSLYTRFSDLQFLKRKFRFDDELGDYMAPIEPKTIVRGLHYYCDNKKLNWEAHHVNILFQISQLALPFGREAYEDVLGLFRSLATLDSLRDRPEFLSYGYTWNFTSFEDYLIRVRGNDYESPAMYDDSDAILVGSFNEYGNEQIPGRQGNHFRRVMYKAMMRKLSTDSLDSVSRRLIDILCQAYFLLCQSVHMKPNVTSMVGYRSDGEWFLGPCDFVRYDCPSDNIPYYILNSAKANKTFIFASDDFIPSTYTHYDVSNFRHAALTYNLLQSISLMHGGLEYVVEHATCHRLGRLYNRIRISCSKFTVYFYYCHNIMRITSR